MNLERKLIQLLVSAVCLLLALSMGAASLNAISRMRRQHQQQQQVRVQRHVRRVESTQPEMVAADDEVAPFSFFNDGVVAR